MFIVQEAIHADYVSSHETREEEVEAIADLIQQAWLPRATSTSASSTPKDESSP
jgi:hypothetical protein